jgi:septal ring factor EnvC (AmiA/AmiB activator)
MPDPRKSRQPGAEPARVTRDPRVDSTPPAALDEAPLGHLHHVAHTFSRPTAAPPSDRLATLEAEVERLRGQLANDADDTAGMLVRIAESERMHVSAHATALEAGARASTLEAELEKASRRVNDLERELEGLRQQWSLSEARLSAARESMRGAFGLVEELERREEMAAAIRARTIRDAMQALRDEPSTPVSAESSVEVVGGHDPSREGEWDLDIAK